MSSAALPTAGKPPLPSISRGATPSPIGSASPYPSSSNLHTIGAAGNLAASLSSAQKSHGNYAKPISREHSQRDLSLIQKTISKISSHPLDTQAKPAGQDTTESLLGLIKMKKTPTIENLQVAQTAALNSIIQTGQNINPEIVVKIRTQEIFNNVLAKNA